MCGGRSLREEEEEGEKGANETEPDEGGVSSPASCPGFDGTCLGARLPTPPVASLLHSSCPPTSYSATKMKMDWSHPAEITLMPTFFGYT